MRIAAEPTNPRMRRARYMNSATHCGSYSLITTGRDFFVMSYSVIAFRNAFNGYVRRHIIVFLHRYHIRCNDHQGPLPVSVQRYGSSRGNLYRDPFASVPSAVLIEPVHLWKQWGVEHRAH